MSLSGKSEVDKIELLKDMVLIREFENQAKVLGLDAEIPGTMHLSTGQEAVAVGVVSALDNDDAVVSTHRGHGHALAKGLDPKEAMAELFGTTNGCNTGKGGTMHLADEEKGFYGGNGIVGASIPLAAGSALTSAYRDDDRVSVGFMGDGAVAQGQMHEAINMAANWDVPAIFVIDNNQWGEGTPVHEQHNVENLSETAQAYDIPGVTVDGQDVLAVREAAEKAYERAQNGEGPTLIEGDTCRYESHGLGSPQPYRTEADIEKWKGDRDPIEMLRSSMKANGELTDEEFDELVADIKSQIDEAVEYARQSEEPDPEAAYEDMFVERVPEIDYHRQ